MYERLGRENRGLFRGDCVIQLSVFRAGAHDYVPPVRENATLSASAHLRHIAISNQLNANFINQREKTMKLKFVLTAASVLLLPITSYALPITINPVADGSLYTCAGCNTVSDGAYVLTSGYIQGAVKFSTASITGIVSKALLTLNPYGLPLWGSTVDVYGYGTTIGALDVTDANAGTLLGTLTLPANLSYGQDAYFDVTALFTSANSPYVAFNLRSTGTDVFSSMEYNYGHPSQLLVTTVPEPCSIALVAVGLLALRTRRSADSRTPA